MIQNKDTISENEFMDMFADNLRDAMIEKGYSQRELAEEARISEASISSYLKARKLIGIRPLLNICMVLDCDVADILPYEGYTMID